MGTRTRIVIAVAGALALAGLACGLGAPAAPGSTQPAQAPAAPAGSTADLARATVQILALQTAGDSYEVVWSGSGTIIRRDGLILTNGHVVDDRLSEYEFLGVAITDRTDEPPDLLYRAEIASADYALDLAVIRIIADIDGRPVTPELPAIAVGDSDRVEIGDHLRVLGYPGIGGETITYTEGAVSGFTSERAVEGRAWIKTDATIAGGNSGGMAVNAAGELIGIPTRASAGGSEGEIVDCRPVVDTNRDGVIDDNDTCVPIGGFINGLRPVNLARPLIAAAESGEPYAAAPLAPPPSGGYDLTETYFTSLVFSDGVSEDDRPKDLWHALPGGTAELCAFWDYEGMTNGMRWSAYWFVNGELDEGGSYLDEMWDGGGAGNWWVCVLNEGGLDDGLYELVLEVESEYMLADSIFVGGDHALVDFTLVNDSGERVCYAYIAPSQAENWGQDRLGREESVLPGESRVFQFASGAYDALLADCDGKTLLEQYGIDLARERTLSLSSSG
jgi:S1-C subfamily serine protease